MTFAVKIFASHTQEDQVFQHQLRKHLEPLVMQSLIRVWSSAEMSPGGSIEKIHKRQLCDAQIVLLLLSPDFIASADCHRFVSQQVMEQCERKGTCVIPIILRSVAWEFPPYNRFKVLPEGGKPIALWRDQDEVWLTVVRGISEVAHIPASFPSLPQSSRPLGTLLCKYEEHASQVLCLAWAPGEQKSSPRRKERLACAGADGVVHLWDAETGQRLSTYRRHFGLRDEIGLRSTINKVVWSPNGLCIASAGSDKRVQVWSPTTSTTVSLYQAHKSLPTDGCIWALAWSPDGALIASSCGSTIDRAVHVWDIATSRALFHYNHQVSFANGTISALAWSPDGSRVASCSDGMIQVWSAMNGKRLSTYMLPSIIIGRLLLSRWM